MRHVKKTVINSGTSNSIAKRNRDHFSFDKIKNPMSQQLVTLQPRCLDN